MKVAALLLAVAVLAGVVSLATVAGATAAPAGPGAGRVLAGLCTVTGPLPGLGPEQAANAGTVVSAALAASGGIPRAARIALMVAITESGLRNLDHGDRDSLGLFQQRPSQGWGTPAQVMDPAYATAIFVARLLAVPSWQQAAPWVAAQDVQHSARADGSNYRANWSAAGSVIAGVIGAGTAPGGCGQSAGGVTGAPGSHGLPVGYAIPAGTPPAHAAAVAFAVAQLGKPYVWAAAGPGSFDCSGLTAAAWAAAGVHLAHYTGAQQSEGAPVTAAGLIPGDLVLTPGSDSPGPGVAGHVGVYLGAGLVESAIDPADGVAVQPWSTFVSGGLVALRDPAPGQ